MGSVRRVTVRNWAKVMMRPGLILRSQYQLRASIDSAASIEYQDLQAVRIETPK